MQLFLDSSALAKKYIEEPATSTLLSYCKKAKSISISVICILEIISALNRLRRENKIDTEQYNKIKIEFLQDIDDFNVIEITPSVINISIACLEKGTIRSLDALHVGCAVSSGCNLFLTSDKRQYNIAGKMNIKAKLI